MQRSYVSCASCRAPWRRRQLSHTTSRQDAQGLEVKGHFASVEQGTSQIAMTYYHNPSRQPAHYLFLNSPSFLLLEGIVKEIFMQDQSGCRYYTAGSTSLGELLEYQACIDPLLPNQVINALLGRGRTHWTIPTCSIYLSGSSAKPRDELRITVYT